MQVNLTFIVSFVSVVSLKDERGSAAAAIKYIKKGMLTLSDKPHKRRAKKPPLTSRRS